MKARKILLIVVALILIVTACVWRYLEESKGLPADFFPSQVGATWRYTIEVGTVVKPVRQYTSFWSIGGDNGRAAYMSRGFLFGAVVGNDADKPVKVLEYRVKCKASKQGPAFSCALGVEIEVLKDELQVFRGAERVFWAITDTDRFQAQLVTVLDPSDAPGGGGFSSDGYSNRFIFFESGKSGLGLGEVIGDNTPEGLFFIGREAGMLHFQRIIDPKKADNDLVDKSFDPLRARFTEDMWYASGKGLFKLIQDYGGATSMIWSLTSYQP